MTETLPNKKAEFPLIIVVVIIFLISIVVVTIIVLNFRFIGN
jgi:hypothetical protein